jgi:hypothetical protein
MQKIYLTAALALLGVQLFAQSDAEKKVKEEIWKSAPAEFKVTEVPDKWKNESAVILALQREYIGDFAVKVTNRLYVEKLTYHFRIKLLDKAAVETFSELSFDNTHIRTNIFGKSSAYSIIGIKVVKPNGTEKQVDLSNAVKTDLGSSKDKKIPIPNLEIGDILDYFIALKDEINGEPNFSDEDLLEQRYPIVANLITFKVPHQFDLYNASYNGAPAFKKQMIDRDKIYTIKDEMREKAPDLIWDFDYRTAPHIRYKLSTDTKKPDTKATAKRYVSAFNYNMSDIGFMVDFINGNFKKEKDKRKLVYEACYMLNNPIYKKAYFGIETGDPLNVGYIPDLYFGLLDKFLSKYDIPHEVVLSTNRRFGDFNDLVNLSACDFVMKVGTTPPILIPRPSPFTIPGEVPYVFEGMPASTETGEYKIPISKMDDNNTTTTVTASLNADDNNKVNIKRSIVAKGHSKDFHQYSIVTNYDYLKEYDQAKYQVESSHKLKGIIKDYNLEKTKLEQRLVQDYTDRDNRMKEYVEKEFEVKVSDYKNLNVKSMGMWHTSPATEYSDEFSVENLVKKAGPNLIISAGHFIEKQTEIKDEDKKRTRDVYMAYPRSFTYEINVQIPDGYSVEGLDNFNKTIENDLGGFVSTATVQGSTVNIKTKKYYTSNFGKAEEWPKIVSFLDAAVEFYNAKLLLKKK